MMNYEKYINTYMEVQVNNPLNCFNNFTNVKIELLDVYKIISEKRPNLEINKIKETLSLKKTEKIKDIISLYENQILSIIGKYDLDDKKYYIYSYSSLGKLFYFLSKIKYNNNNIKEILEKYDIINEGKKYDLKLEEKIYTKLKLLANLKVDRYIYEHDTIKNGYNTQYNVIKEDYTIDDIHSIARDVFSKVQLELFKDTYDDSQKPENEEFVYRIEIEGKNFVDMETKGKSVSNIIKNIYEGKKIDKKYNKLKREILKSPYNKIKIEYFETESNLSKLMSKKIEEFNAEDEQYGLNMNEKDYKNDFIKKTFYMKKINK